MVFKIDNQTVPLLNASMTAQLNHMADLTNALIYHLNEILKKRVTQIDRDTAARIHHLEEEHPCQRLKIQQGQLEKVKEVCR